MIVFEALTQNHWEKVKEIYEEGIKTGHATFETTAPDWEDWNNSHVENCRIIAKVDEEIGGWAALTAVSQMCICRCR